MLKKQLFLFLTAVSLILAAGCTSGPAPEYEVVIEIEPAGAGSTAGSGIYEEGEEIALAAEPREGYLFKKWTENGKKLSADTTLHFRIAEDRNLVAEFKKEKVEASLLAVGDIMVHQTQFRQAYNQNKGIYDFSPSFELVSSFIQEADLAVGNLETTLAGAYREYSAFPRFNSPDEIACALSEAGFDLLATANNHSLDSGDRGLYRTLEVLEDAGIKPFGTARSIEERNTPRLVEIEELKLAFLAYTYGTNMIPVPEGKDYIVNLIDIELIREDIQRAREEGANLVVLFMHWGVEYQAEPSAEQKELARQTAKAGADIILGSHPHVLQPLEWLHVTDEEGREHTALVIYSLGNFISNQHRTNSVPTGDVEFGLLLSLQLEKNLGTGEARISEVDCTVTWVHRAWRHRVIPLDKIEGQPPEEYHISAAKKQELLNTRDRLSLHLQSYNVECRN